MATIANAKHGVTVAAVPGGHVQPKKGKGSEVRLDPGQSYRSAMRALIGQRWGEVWKAVPVALAGEDIEGVHAVRVASRRLRAAMDVAADCFPASWFRPLHTAAKEITGALGEVRDRDVLLEALAAERESAPAAERPGIDRLMVRIEGERVMARAEMERFLAGLAERGVPREAERRFGALAAPPPGPPHADAVAGRDASAGEVRP
ncbi:MAG: hypothetical protein AVDCRST_MAG19-1540 [uncultured Thermomicrobiales bacterium]|uniref:CHAD domain-containing protein n=1 Tax=uncultured Thermomicrobiales bacterium TaxID=1645740 RepID=A0A6J4U902_9BACT|nr:MAG: hypothetical protein AVDCRST_MAG19-1540 [uncultured Thermomicrobiales bacterium]